MFLIDENFNSIKVRLELDSPALCCKHEGNFNSIKVRLEQNNSGSNAENNSFQFHKGAIRTAGGLQSIVIDFNFNSIKVRLEPRKKKAKFC